MLDTSALIESFTGSQRLLPSFRQKVQQGERLVLCSTVLYEWLRGPRLVQELTLQEEAFPHQSILPFGPEEAAIAALLYRTVPRPRGREADLEIAACALRHDAELWTRNVADFKDIPGLRLIR